MCMPIIAVVGTVVKVLLGNEEMDHKAASQTSKQDPWPMSCGIKKYFPKNISQTEKNTEKRFQDFREPYIWQLLIFYGNY